MNKRKGEKKATTKDCKVGSEGSYICTEDNIMFLKRNDTFQIECGERALARPKLLGMLPRKKKL